MNLEGSVKFHELGLLKKRLAKTDATENRAIVLFELAFLLRKKASAEAFGYAIDCLHLSRRLQFKLGIAKAYRVMGLLYWYKNNYYTSISFHKKALILFQKLGDDHRVAYSLNSLGTCHKVIGKFSEALNYFQQSLRILKAQDNVDIGICLNNIGNIYVELSEYDKALEYYFQSIEISKGHNNYFGIATRYNNIGEAMIKCQRYEEAMTYYNKSLKLRTSLKDRSGMASCFINIGDFHRVKGDFDSAIEQYSMALQFHSELQDKLGIIRSYRKIGEVFVKKECHDEAIGILNQGLNQAKKIDANKELMAYYEALSACYIEQGDFYNGHKFYKLYIGVKEGIFNEEKARILSELQARYELEKKEETINQLVADKDIMDSYYQEMEFFVQNVSHDLREPLRMMRSFSDLFYKEYSDNLDKKAAEYLYIIGDSATRMESMLDDMLNYAKVSHKSAKEEFIDLNDIILLVKNNLRLKIKEKQAHINTDCLPVVVGAATHYVLLFQNLISNAIKYTKKEVPPSITIDSETRDNDYLLTIKDNGIGMDENQLLNIFDPFTRLHTKEAFEGTGLGLAICKKIIEKAGGEIWAESKKEVGSVIFLTFPRKI